MRRIVCFLALTCLSVALGGYQDNSAERTIRLRFPDGVDLTGLSIQYFLSGPFGGYGALARIDPAVREQRIDTWRAGQPGKSIKIIIYCPGYGFRLFSESDLAAHPVGTLMIELEPLATVPLRGRISGLTATTGLTVEAGYIRPWLCAFFELADCGQGPLIVATSGIAPDGTFTLNVPNVLTDAAVSRYRDLDPGSLWLRIFGVRDYELEGAQQRGRWITVPIAASYPGNLQLVAVPR